MVNAHLPVDAILEQIPGWTGRVDSVEPLEGGITNRNYRVVVAGETFVVRIGGHRTELLGIDRAIEVEAALPPFKPRFCHNDLLNANFIDDGASIRIVDWEYAGMGDPFFDLGNFAVNHELDPAGERALLQAYTGEARESDLARLRLMR